MGYPKLMEVLLGWPSTAGAGLVESPLPEGTDVIVHASISKENYLILSLSRGETKFTASVQILLAFSAPVRKVGGVTFCL